MLDRETVNTFAHDLRNSFYALETGLLVLKNGQLSDDHTELIVSLNDELDHARKKLGQLIELARAKS